MAKATISQGIKLSYKVGNTGEYVELNDLQGIPDIGGTAQALDITTLADSAFMYCDGIKDYGDSLDFAFLYEKAQFSTLNNLEGSNGWKIELPDGTSCSFSGTSSVKLDGAGVNTVLTYTLAVKPDSEMVWA